MTFRTEVSGPASEALAPDWIFDQIQEWARRSPDRVAFVIDQKDKVEEYRYADVLDRADEFASALISKGIQRGDHIGILMENVPQWVFALLGAMRIGAVTVPLATALPENSIQLIAEHAGCKVMVADETNWEKASPVAASLGAALLCPSAVGEVREAQTRQRLCAIRLARGRSEFATPIAHHPRRRRGSPTTLASERLPRTNAKP